MQDYPIRLYGELKHSLVNGPGIRRVIFVQGCNHNCPGCQNPDSHPMNSGKVVSAAELAERITHDKVLDGITLSGGEPMLQAEACGLIAGTCRKAGLSVWCYTGYVFEDIVSGKAGTQAASLLKQIDVLVDGPFVQELASDQCLYRGSTNQRLIDVPASLQEGRTIIYSEKED